MGSNPSRADQPPQSDGERLLIETALLWLAALVQAQPLLGLLCCAAIGLPLWLGWWSFWRLGRQTIESGCFPPPGTRTLRAVEPIFGAAAVRRGRGLCALSLVLTLLTGLMVVMFWGLLQSLGTPAP